MVTTDQRQGEQLELLENDRRRQQADKLAVWLDFESDTDAPPESPRWRWYFKLRNASELPIYELRAWAQMADVDGGTRLAFVWFRTLAPESEVVTVQVFGGSISSLRAGMYNEPLRLVNLTFRDAGGKCWFRRESRLEVLEYEEYVQVTTHADVAAGRRRD